MASALEASALSTTKTATDARAAGRGWRALFVGGAIAAALFVAAPVSAAPAAQPASEPKKVGTERITINPVPAVPEAPIPHGAGPAPVVPPKPAAERVPVEIHRGIDGLPPGVVKMRQRLLDAAYSGDMQRLKVVAQSNETPPIFSINEIGDPIAYLKAQSGDGQGLEVLAILTDVLEAGWARINPGTPQEMFVWPAYAAMPLDHLEPGQVVELYKIVTSSDLEEMKSVGRYTFYTVGIGPDGTWHWFKLAD